jgi:hypothetical protein
MSGALHLDADVDVVRLTHHRSRHVFAKCCSARNFFAAQLPPSSFCQTWLLILQHFQIT